MRGDPESLIVLLFLVLPVFSVEEYINPGSQLSDILKYKDFWKIPWQLIQYGREK